MACVPILMIFDCYVTTIILLFVAYMKLMLTKDDFIIRGFNCINLTSRDIGGRACGGVSVLVRDGIPYSECKLHTTLQAKAVTISTSKTITICSLYFPPSLIIVLLSRLIDQLPAPFLICGDFNGHSITWGCDKNNSRWNLSLYGGGTYLYMKIELTILLQTKIFVYLMMVHIHMCTQPQEHSQRLIILCVLRTFLWRLIFWLNRIHMVVIIFLLFKKLVFRFLMHYPVGI